MRLRSFIESDIARIDEIWRQHHQTEFSVPNRNCSLIDAVVETNAGKVIAYGQTRLFAEAQLILDLSESKKNRVEAVKLLMLEAFRGTREFKLEEIYAFVKDPEFARLIEKHFFFERVEYPGDLLLRRL